MVCDILCPSIMKRKKRQLLNSFRYSAFFKGQSPLKEALLNANQVHLDRKKGRSFQRLYPFNLSLDQKIRKPLARALLT